VGLWVAPRGGLGRYRLLDQMAGGAMGLVYRAYDPDLDRLVAIKIIRGETSERSRARLLREARSLARFQHPNIVPIYDVGIEGDTIYLVMQHLECVTLRSWLRAAPRSWQEVVQIFIDAGRALAAVHEIGYGHRDFKPDNLVVTADGTVKLVDFGLSKSLSEVGDDPLGAISGSAPEPTSYGQTVTRSGAIVGTPAYMAPEQFRQLPADARADQFSFCVALWEAVYGQRPFRAKKTSQLAVRVCSGKIQRPRRMVSLSPALETLLRRGLRPNPEHRYENMDAVVNALSQILAEADQDAEPSQVADVEAVERACLDTIGQLAKAGRMRDAMRLLESMAQAS
jgi:serine/threonine protein kinase